MCIGICIPGMDESWVWESFAARACGKAAESTVWPEAGAGKNAANNKIVKNAFLTANLMVNFPGCEHDALRAQSFDPSRQALLGTTRQED